MELKNQDTKKVKYFIIKKRVQLRCLCLGGWGNGYIVVPPNHTLHGLDLKDLPEDIEVHGGITFSRLFSDFPEKLKPKNIEIGDDWWVFGFDTMHCDDTVKNWPKKRVEAETKRIALELENYKKQSNKNARISRRSAREYRHERIRQLAQ